MGKHFWNSAKSELHVSHCKVYIVWAENAFIVSTQISAVEFTPMNSYASLGFRLKIITIYRYADSLRCIIESWFDVCKPIEMIYQKDASKCMLL